MKTWKVGGCNCGGNTKNSAFKLRDCLLCALIFEKKIKLFLKFTFLKMFKFFLLKKWGVQGIRENTVFVIPPPQQFCFSMKCDSCKV
jgi:hypothetical protein